MKLILYGRLHRYLFNIPEAFFSFHYIFDTDKKKKDEWH